MDSSKIAINLKYQQPTVINTAEDLEPLLAAITSMYNIVHFNMD